MAKKTKVPSDMIVFLSSTFRDLESHRGVLKLALESSGYRVFGMEVFAASPNPPLKTCIAELNKSHIYVGIVGEYFGSCPPGYKKSYTQLEYERAKKQKMPMFIFMTGDDAVFTRAQFENDAEKRKRLNAFKARLKNQHTVAFFKDAHEAAWQILAALRKHELQVREKKGKK